jgi:hypothetical protein
MSGSRFVASGRRISCASARLSTLTLEAQERQCPEPCPIHKAPGPWLSAHLPGKLCHHLDGPRCRQAHMRRAHTRPMQDWRVRPKRNRPGRQTVRTGVEVLRTLSGTAPTWEYWLSSFPVPSLPVSNLRELSQPHMPPIPESSESGALPHLRPHYFLRESQLTSREPTLNTLTKTAYEVRERVTR